MLIIGKEAEKDIREAYDWYERKLKSLGTSFLAEIEATLEKIQENPHLYALVHQSMRRALCRRFPYAVYYMETKSSIVVLAVLQQRRKPVVWKKRKLV